MTPFGVVNDTAGRVTVVLDASLMAHERMNFHPLVNTMTTAIAREDLLASCSSTGHEPGSIACPGAAGPDECTEWPADGIPTS